jgi:hypothetical protein
MPAFTVIAKGKDETMRLLPRTARTLLLTALVVIMGILAVAPASAQDTAEVNPNANILFPLPVSVLTGQFPILGTADATGMTNYFLEFRPITLPTEPRAGVTPTPTQPPTFFPAVLPSNRPVTAGLLGTWDTTLVPDGLYELRLTVNVSGSAPLVTTVGPLRIQNTLDPEVQTLLNDLGITLGGSTSVQPTAAPDVPTAVPTATIIPTEDPTPRGTVTTATANVRTGDGTNFPAITSLPEGTVVTLVGISNQGSGWYQVRTPTGALGWMSPSVISVSGDTSRLPRVQPPPPPVTPTFTPVPFTATPVTTTNLVAGNIFLTPDPPVCNQTFQVGIDIANLGGQANAVSGLFTVTITHVATGTVTGSTQGPIPIIQPGVTQRIDVPITVSTFFNETHRVTVVLDPSAQIPETNRGDNTSTREFTLQKGGCA